MTESNTKSVGCVYADNCCYDFALHCKVVLLRACTASYGGCLFFEGRDGLRARLVLHTCRILQDVRIIPWFAVRTNITVSGGRSLQHQDDL